MYKVLVDRLTTTALQDWLRGAGTVHHVVPGACLRDSPPPTHRSFISLANDLRHIRRWKQRGDNTISTRDNRDVSLLGCHVISTSSLVITLHPETQRANS